LWAATASKVIFTIGFAVRSISVNAGFTTRTFKTVVPFEFFLEFIIDFFNLWCSWRYTGSKRHRLAIGGW